MLASLNNLGRLYETQGQYAKAESQHGRALTIKEKALGPNHPSVGLTLNNLAYLYFLQQDWANALAYFNRSTDIIVARSRLTGTEAAARTQGEGGSDSFRFVGLIKSAYRLATAERQRASQIISATFLSAQLAETSQTAASLSQMAARQAKGDTGLARQSASCRTWLLIGEHTTSSWLGRSRSRQSSATVAQKKLYAPAGSDEKRSGEIKASLTKEFPEYAALSSSEPLSAAETQAILGENEALVLYWTRPNGNRRPRRRLPGY